MTLDQDEELFVDALHRSTVPAPDLTAIAARATRSGTRLRHRHQARAAVATLAVVGVGVGAGRRARLRRRSPGRTSTPSVATEPSVTPAPAVPSLPPPALDTSSAYAVLDAPGWVAPLDNVIADEKLYYVQDGTDASVSLNWRPIDLGSKFTIAQLQAELQLRYGGATLVGTTTIDDDPANIFRDHGMLTVVGGIEQGRFLTLSGSGLTLAQLTELATHVHRQAPEHEAGMP